MPTCSNCGQTISYYDKTCPHCRYSLGEQTSAPYNPNLGAVPTSQPYQGEAPPPHPGPASQPYPSGRPPPPRPPTPPHPPPPPPP
ncbi:MAG: hypothetical protein LBF38_06575, partial [Deltaproteobacteria bacterium]|nr:hypothetical protein [Deltaproteobacteria bacterium]